MPDPSPLRPPNISLKYLLDQLTPDAQRLLSMTVEHSNRHRQNLWLVGGAVRVHPTAKANVAIMGARTADELAKVIAAAGIAQNLGALRALATVGIQAGHMKLHSRNMAVTAGANDDEVDKVVEIARASGRITAAAIEAALEQVRNS